MANINRDYLIVNDVKKSNITLDNGSMFFYITDKNTQNIFVNLVINISNNDLIQKYANIENAEDYTLTMNIVKPDNTYKIIEGKLHDKEKAIFEFDLNEDCCDEIGTYRCELLTKCNINGHEEITTSNKLTYKVKSSVLNDLDDIVEAPEYPLVIQLFDKLSDINQYEEDRRANELARQLAEEQRQTRFDALDADMTNSIQAMDDKMVDVENRVSTKEQAVDKLINDTKAEIDDYKVAKDQEIDEYKATKDTEINNAITAQDNKIDTAISEQNDRITLVENNVVSQNNRLDIVENRNTQQDNRLDAVEAKNVEQDNRLDEIEAIDVSQNNRLDAIEAKNQQQDDRLLDIEKVNKRQDIDLKCLFTEAKNNMMDITEEGNSVYLQNSTTGYTLVDEIKGNTLVNCNKEPDKELILNGNINTSGDNAVTITEGVDGGLVDVALEGNTLVNVSKTKNVTALPLDEELTYLYANTQYTVQFISTAATTADITLGGTQLLAQSIVDGLNRITITTPATLVDNKLIIDGVGANISEVVVTDTNRDFRYFEGMKSVGECEELEVKSGNKNILNPTKNLKYPYFIPKGTKLTLSTKDGVPSEGGNVLLYDINGDIQWFPIDLGKSTNTITTSKDIYYMQNQLIITGTIEFQVEIGEVATSYVPYTINVQQLAHEPLRAIGDTKDRYVLIDGKWYIERNCLEIMLDENLPLYYQPVGNGFAYARLPYQIEGINRFICDKRISKVRITTNSDNTSEGIYLFADNNQTQIRIRIKLGYTLDETKQYLQENPIKLVYQLASPVYEPIDYNPLEVYADVTHISTNSVIPTNITVKNHGFNCLLKPSTTYTVSSNLGLNTVTTGADIGDSCLRFYNEDTSNVTTMKDVLILEGDWTSKADLIPSNFSGIESAFEQEYDAENGKYRVTAKVANEDKTKENNITFYINEPLRGVGNVKDRVYVKDDKVVVQRNCGSVAVNDNDDISKASEGYDSINNITFSILMDNLLSAWLTPNNILCSTLPSVGHYVWGGMTEGITSDTVKILFSISRAKLQTQDIEGFRQWLKQNPTTVVYQLAEPTYEEVEYNDVKLFIESFKNSTLSYNSNIPVTSTVHYSYSVPIVDTVAQTANVTDQQDSMIIDLATQVAVMEMMLM